MLLAACSSPKPVTRNELVIVSPPAYLLEECRKTTPAKLETNGNLLFFAMNLSDDIDACNEQIGLIRSYTEETVKNK